MALDTGEQIRHGFVTDADGRIVITGDAITEVEIEGNIAAGAADDGNPVKVGGKYNASSPTLTSGNRGDIQLDSRGRVKTVIGNGASSVDVVTPADDVSNGNTGLVTAGLNFVYDGTAWDRARSDGTTGGQAVGGSVAHAAADSGNPVKVGGKYNASAVNLTDGNRGDLQLNQRGAVRVDLWDRNGNGVDLLAGSADGVTAADRGLPARSFDYAFNGATWDRLRTASVFKPVSVAITAGTPQTIWTPAVGKKFRLMGWAISSSAGGTVLFYDNTGAVTMIARAPKAATNGLNNSPPNMGNGYISLAANNVLQLDSDTTATFTGFVFGTEE